MKVKIPLLGFAPGHCLTVERKKGNWKFDLINYQKGLRFSTMGNSFFDRASRMIKYVSTLRVNKGIDRHTYRPI